MTPEQISLVQSSFARLGPQLSVVTARFYDELFARDPALRPLFTTDMAEQRVRFARKLSEIVQAIPRLDELLAHTRALGAAHVGYGVKASDYRTVEAALLAALAPSSATASTNPRGRRGPSPTTSSPKPCSKVPPPPAPLAADPSPATGRNRGRRTNTRTASLANPRATSAAAGCPRRRLR
jgi:hemoglobin-like flavoprotein